MYYLCVAYTLGPPQAARESGVGGTHASDAYYPLPLALAPITGWGSLFPPLGACAH